MTNKEKRLAIRNLTPDTTNWTALLAPMGCNFVNIVNQTSVQIKVRTDDTLSSSEMTIDVGESYPLHLHPVMSPTRFMSGDPVAYFQLSGSGTGNVIGVFTL